ncbi:hypothetical protein [Succinimonas amylolytica]|uniref:hypothetical protein n=1 Tax=Succinimonas amylolytica TaxID=83769 RepID=UPI0003691446|nr:hypothetical protein [Succinimonas amylolytica]
MAEAKNRRCRLGLASSDGRFPAEFYGVSPEGLTFSLMSLGGSSYIGPGGNVNRGEEFRWKIHCDYPGRPLQGRYVFELSREMVSLAACSHKSFQLRIYDAGGVLLALQKLSPADLDVNRTETFPGPERAQAFITGDGSGNMSRKDVPEERREPEDSGSLPEESAAGSGEAQPQAPVPEVSDKESIPGDDPAETLPGDLPLEIPETVSPVPVSRKRSETDSGERFVRSFRTGGYQESRGCSLLSFYYLAVLAAVTALAVAVVLSLL